MTSSPPSKPLPSRKPSILRGVSLQKFREPDLDTPEGITELPGSFPVLQREGVTMAEENSDHDEIVPAERRLIIAIDYGTTFTGVAYATPNTHITDLREIRLVQYWGSQMGNTDKVPSVISYSPKTDGDEQQWGASLSPNAVAMVNSKLELDVQDNKADELDLILQVLDGTNDLTFQNVKDARGHPAYTWKPPEEVVTDYLTEVFRYVEKLISDFAAEMSSRLPVDIVLTVPVGWSYRAKDSTLRAVRNAGFNEKTFPLLRDVIMVTEPEAAAVYTARHLKEELGLDFLKKGECFVLCDAGGGTVDVVSYKVIELTPLALEPLTLPTGAKCGSIYIDGNFKRWLQNLLGEQNYRKLAPKSGQKITPHDVEGRWMREIMKVFDTHKRNFCNDGRNMKMDFTEPDLASLDLPGKVEEGEFTITNDDMKDFFDPCVDRIIELIEGQRDQVERRGSRVKNIFLVGGFGESRYLQNELNDSMRRRNIQLRRPETSWSAVVRGAVIFGVEKSKHKNITVTKASSRSYGIMTDSHYQTRQHDKRDHVIDKLTGRMMAKGQMNWLVRKGDLLLSDVPKETEKSLLFNFQAKDDKSVEIPILMYPFDDVPDRFDNSRNELTEVGTLSFDLSIIPYEDLNEIENPNSSTRYYEARCSCKAKLWEDTLTIEVLFNETLLCSVKISYE